MAATVLLAEDNDILRHVVARTLEQCGYEVLEARTLPEAVAVFQAGTAIDVIVSDVGLIAREEPAHIDTLHRLIARIPVAYVSGHPVELAKQRYTLRPGSPYLQKPFDLDDLLTTILTLIAPPSGPDVA